MAFVMICGTLLSLILQDRRSPTGERYGAVVAENELIRATLAGSKDLSWEFFVNGVEQSLTETIDARGRHPHLVDLRQRYGNRVTTRSLASLSRSSDREPNIFVTNVPSVVALCESRRRMGHNRLPICGLVHSIFTKNMLSTYSSIVLNMEDGDVLVASSASGRRALETIFETVSAQIADYCGHKKTALRMPTIVDIPFGVNVPELESIDIRQARTLFQLSQNSFTILYIGRLAEDYKADLDPLLQAVAILATKAWDVKLLLAGQALDQTYNHHLRKRLRYLNLEHRAVIIENFPEYLKSSLLAAANVVVSPADSIQETFGISLLEAMSHARPVIATSWSGYKDIVVDGETGYLLKSYVSASHIETAEALASLTKPRELAHFLAQGTIFDIEELVSKLERLAANPRDAVEMGHRGRQRIIERFAWSDISSRFINLWSDQAALAQRKMVTKPPLTGLEGIFGHYADAVLSPATRISAVGVTGMSDLELLSTWEFRKSITKERIAEIIALCRKEPISIARLQALNYSAEEILWPIKKGLCTMDIEKE